MSLIPVDKQSGKRRGTNEHEQNRLRREKEKADWSKRNPDSKYKH